MRVRFWGVCGSIPAPLTPSQVKSKISAVIEQIKPQDIKSSESRERFLAGLPPWIFGTVGGNSPCVSVSFDHSGEMLVFDCGSGLRELGTSVPGETNKPDTYHVFFSHYHWDHLHGLPFFNPAYDSSVKINFYAPMPDLQKVLEGQMVQPYFPIPMASMSAKKEFHQLDGPVDIQGKTIRFKKMNHPGDSYAYSVSENGKRFIYATDCELKDSDFIKNDENTEFFQDADLLVIDCQFTLGEAIDKNNWGHSAFSLAADFTANWRVKHLVMFHRDPAHNDREMHKILQSARWYLERMNIKGTEITLATEGLEINL
jgi:phosphoribosyl 1,2-cyclic phosphodiesterase